MSLEANPWHSISVPISPNFFTTKSVVGPINHNFLWVVDQAGRKGFAITLDQKISGTTTFPNLENIEICLHQTRRM